MAASPIIIPVPVPTIGMDHEIVTYSLEWWMFAGISLFLVAFGVMMIAAALFCFRIAIENGIRGELIPPGHFRRRPDKADLWIATTLGILLALMAFVSFGPFIAVILDIVK